MTDDVDRIGLWRVVSNWVNAIFVIAACVLALLVFPWYSALPILAIGAFSVARAIVRQATAIGFDSDGVDVSLILRKRHIRRPVAEFDGSRSRGVVVHDLHTDKSYTVALTRNARVVHAIESHGYAVIDRPRHVFR